MIREECIKRAQLCEGLKLLRLPGMIEAVQRQFDSPEYSEKTFTDRILDIVMNEVQNRKFRRQCRLLKESGMTMPMASFDHLDIDPQRGLDRALIEELKTCEWMLAPMHPSLLVSGPTGTGKSFLVQCFGRQACLNSLSTAYYRMPVFLEQLEDASRSKEPSRFRHRVNSKAVLILDDFGMSAMDPELSRDLLSMLVERDSVGTTIIASQLPFEQWHDTIKQAWDADAIIDRLLGGSYRITLKGESMRLRKRSD